MRLMGLRAIYPKRNLSKRHPGHKIYPYLLRDRKITHPNQVWATDITYIRLRQGFVCLVAVLDWYSRYVLSWRISNTLDVSFCRAALEEALEKGSPEIFNSDQGSQFTSDEFTRILLSKEITISMDGRGRAFDNIFTERLWRSVKYEEVYLKDYQVCREAHEGLEKYFTFYSHRIWLIGDSFDANSKNTLKERLVVNQLKQLIKERLLKRLNVSYNRYGLPNSLFKYLNKREISLVDIGAHNGDFTAMIASYCGISKGILIEVIPEKVECLRKQFAAPKYTIFDCAISSKEGFLEFEINEATATSSLLRIKREMHELSNVNIGKGTIIDCRARTLDSIMGETNLSHIDLLKLDVQGAEHLVLEGAKQAIKKTSMVWTEVSFKPLYEESSDFCLLYQMFYERGFELMELESDFRAPSGELLQGNALFINREQNK